MPSFSSTAQPVIIVQANPLRTSLKITNLSDTTLYLANFGVTERFSERALPIKLEGMFEIEGPEIYKGPIWGMVTAESDIRIWES